MAALLAASGLTGALHAGTVTSWTGVASNDYGVSANWSNGIPNGAFNAVIPGGTPTSPPLTTAT